MQAFEHRAYSMHHTVLEAWYSWERLYQLKLRQRTIRKGGGDMAKYYSELEKILVNMFSIGRLTGVFFAGFNWRC